MIYSYSGMKFLSDRGHIRSFVLRKGKMTSGQRQAVAKLMPRYALEPEKVLDFAAIFGNHHPVWLDIGFGNGESIIHAAQHYPKVNILGIEVHLPGVGRLLMAADEHNLNNIRIIRNDAVDIIRAFVPDDSLQAVHIYFPDPWHKKRHHKRRLVQQPFLDLIRTKLKSGGRFHFATDWQPYAEEVADLLQQNKDWLCDSQQESRYAPRPDWRPITKFERRGQRLNHASFDLIWHKI